MSHPNRAIRNAATTLGHRIRFESLEPRLLLDAQIGTVTMPFDGYLSAAVYDQAGQVVKYIEQHGWHASGESVPLMWDGTNVFDEVAPTGVDYEWRAAIGQVEAVDEYGVGDSRFTTEPPILQGDVYRDACFGVVDIAVDPSGDWYTASFFEETGQKLRKNTVGGEFVWYRNLQGSYSVAANGTYCYSVQKVGGEHRINRVWASDGTDAFFPAMDLDDWITIYDEEYDPRYPGHAGYTLDQSRKLNGAMISAGETTLLVSDYRYDKVHLFDAETGSKKTQIDVAGAIGITIERDYDGSPGAFWVACEGDKVRRFTFTDNGGQYDVTEDETRTITGLQDPTGVFFGGPNAHLYVCETAAGAIREYDVSGSPTPAGLQSFGSLYTGGPLADNEFDWTMEWGYNNGRASAVVGPEGYMTVEDRDTRRQRFYAVDMDGHVAGELYQSHHSTFVTSPTNAYDFGADGAHRILTDGFVYEVEPNYTGGPREGWLREGTWRLVQRMPLAGKPGVRTVLNDGVNDRVFYYVLMEKGGAAIYEIDGADYYFRGLIGDQWTGTDLLGEDEGGRFIWIDDDLDGEIDWDESNPNPSNGEVVFSVEPGEGGHMGAKPWVDKHGSFWFETGGDIYELPISGWSASGLPIYDFANATLRVQTPNDELGFGPYTFRIADNGEIWACGNSKLEDPAGTFGFHGGNVFVRYAPDGSRLGYFPSIDYRVVTLAIDEDLPTVDYYFHGTADADQHYVYMHTVDGLMLTRCEFGEASGYRGGWIDHGHALMAFTHPITDQLYVYAEEVFYGKTTRYRIDGLDTVRREGMRFTWLGDGIGAGQVLHVEVADDTVNEAGPVGDFRITRVGDNGADLTVYYTMSGTATEGADYAATAGSVVIPAGRFDAAVTIAPADDGEAENDETALLTVTHDAAYTVGVDNGTITILDDEPRASIVAMDSSAAEPSDAGEFVVTRTVAIGDMTVYYGVSGSAAPGDYSPTLSGSVVIPDGESSVAISITPVDDSALEPADKTLTLTLTPDTAYSIGQAADTVSIRDDDFPTVEVTATTPDATEEGPVDGAFTITRGGSTVGDLTVNYTVGGDATAGSDYGALASSAVILDGQSSVIITVAPIDDGENEPVDEMVSLTLDADASYWIGTADQAVVTVIDNDVPRVSFVASVDTASEAGPEQITYSVSRAFSTAGDLTVFYTVVGGTAGPGSDYAPLPGSVVIPDGLACTEILVDANDDARVEDSETILIDVNPNASYSVEPPTRVTATLTDDDQPSVTIVASDAEASEAGWGTGELVISRTEVGPDLWNVVDYPWTQLPRPMITSSIGASTGIVQSLWGTGPEDFLLGDRWAPTEAMTATANADFWAIVSLDQPREVEQVVVEWWCQNDATISAFSLEGSNDGENWTQIGFHDYGSPQYAGLGLKTVIDVADANWRHVRVYVSEGDYTTANAHGIGGPGLLIIEPVGDGVLFEDEVNWLNEATFGTTVSNSGMNPAQNHTRYNDGYLYEDHHKRTGTNGSWGPDQHITMDLKDVRTLDEIWMIWNYGWYASTFDIRYSDDGQTWRSVTGLGEFDQSDWNAVTKVAFDPTAARFWRIVDCVAPRTQIMINQVLMFGPRGLGRSTTVNLDISGTAVAGSDYEPLPSSVVIDAEENSVTLTLTPIDDGALERDDETVIVAIAPGDYVIGTPDEATIAIADDDFPTVQVSATGRTAYERDAVEGEFTFARAGSTVGDLTIHYAISGTAAAGADYQALTGAAVIPDGSTSTTVAVTPIDDGLAESEDDTVIVTLSADAQYWVGAEDVAGVLIADDDLPRLRIVASDPLAHEADGSNAVFTVSRLYDTVGDLTVHYGVSGSSVAGEDYQALPGAVLIPDGLSSVTIDVVPINDDVIEPDESVLLTVSPDTAYSISAEGSDTAQIVSEDVPVLSLSASVALVDEVGPSNGTFVVSRSGSEDPTQLPEVTVFYSVGGSAVNGEDYETLSGGVLLPSGAESAFVAVAVIDDRDVEDAETLVLTLEDDAAYDLGGSVSDTVTLASDDLPIMELIASDAEASEAGPDAGEAVFSRRVERRMIAVEDYNWMQLPLAQLDASFGSTTGEGGSQSGGPIGFLRGDRWAPNEDMTNLGAADWWAIAHLDQPREIERVGVQWWTQGASRIERFTVEGSNDMQTWLTLRSHDYGSPQSAGLGMRTELAVTENPGSYQYIRVYVSAGDYTPAGEYNVGGPGVLGIEAFGDGLVNEDHVNWLHDGMFDTSIDNNSLEIRGERYNEGYTHDRGGGNTMRTGNHVAWEAKDWTWMDLGQPRRIGRMDLVWNYAWKASSYRIWYSHDGATFTEVTGYSAPIYSTNGKASTAYEFDSVFARYWRVTDCADRGIIDSALLYGPEPTLPEIALPYAIGGTAKPEDYGESLTGTLTMAAGEASVAVCITPVQDSYGEGAQTVELTVQADPGYSIGASGEATVTIADDDIRGDFSGDGLLNAPDIDLLFANYGSVPPQDSMYDLSMDGIIGQTDADLLVMNESHMYTHYGDCNLDRDVNDDDLSLLLAGWGGSGGWATGDLTGDGVVDDDDLSRLLANWNQAPTADATPNQHATAEGDTERPVLSANAVLLADEQAKASAQDVRGGSLTTIASVVPLADGLASRWTAQVDPRTDRYRTAPARLGRRPVGFEATLDVLGLLSSGLI